MFLANFLIYPTEFQQRKEMQDKNLWDLEKILIDVKGDEVKGRIWSIVSLIISLLGLITLSISLITMSDRHWFYSNKFFHVELSENLITQYESDRQGTYNYLSYNLLERRFLLTKSEFWTILVIKVVPDLFFDHTKYYAVESHYRNVINEYIIKEGCCLRICLVLYLILVMPLVSILSALILLCPLLDILLHIPWNTKMKTTQGASQNDSTGGKSEGNTDFGPSCWHPCCVRCRKNSKDREEAKKEKINSKEASQSDGTVGEKSSQNDTTDSENAAKSNSTNDRDSASKIILKVMATFTLVLFAVTFAVSYINPTAKLYSLIVSYTIPGVLKTTNQSCLS